MGITGSTNGFQQAPLRLLHTSDLHIGSDIYPEDALRGLESMLASSHKMKVDAIIIAGDLFDNRRIPDTTIDRVFDDLGSFGKPVVVLPGNHDTLLTTGWTSRSLPENVDLIRQEDGELILIEGLNLAVWGRPVFDHNPDFRPLEGLPPRPGNSWYVPIAHGMFMDGQNDEFRSSPISPKEISEAKCDYIALGHVHAFRNVSQSGVLAYYSGAPSGSQRRTVAVVDLNPETGVSVSPLNIR